MLVATSTLRGETVGLAKVVHGAVTNIIPLRPAGRAKGSMVMPQRAIIFTIEEMNRLTVARP